MNSQNGLGYVQKRTRTEPAVVRYPRFSPTKDSEKYYHSILQLFLPHRFEQHLKPQTFSEFENFHDVGSVKLGNQLQTVKSIVERKKCLFEKEGYVIEKAEKLLQTSDDVQDAWAHICPETELERIESIGLIKEIDEDDKDAGDIPDLLPRSEQCLLSEVKQNLL